ncbi:MAG: hypothetical protein ACI86X_001016, partial [Moritella sp.]
MGIYYQNEHHAQGNDELQAWAKKLADIGTEGDHSSINYPQSPYIGFNPNMPLAGYSNYRAFLAKDNPTKA